MLTKLDVRFGSKADICSAKGHVCFTPPRKRTSKPSFPWRRPPLVNRTIGLVPVSPQNRCPPAVRFTPLVATIQPRFFGSSLCASLSFGRVASPKYFLPRLPQDRCISCVPPPAPINAKLMLNAPRRSCDWSIGTFSYAPPISFRNPRARAHTTIATASGKLRMTAATRTSIASLSLISN
jgi:hypothetical protein